MVMASPSAEAEIGQNNRREQKSAIKQLLGCAAAYHGDCSSVNPPAKVRSGVFAGVWGVEADSQAGPGHAKAASAGQMR
jgi:hypothetical protein